MKSTTSRNSVPQHPRATSGFTMVELLVVVVIVATLAAIAFLGARKFIDSASRVKSTDNMRQVAGLVHQFAADNNGILVHCEKTKKTINGVTTQLDWSHYLLLTLYPDLEADGNFGKSSGDTLARESGIFADPKALKRGKSVMPKSGHDNWRTYAYNNRIGAASVNFPGEIPWNQGAKRVIQVRSPDKLILLSQKTLTGDGRYFSFLQPEDGANDDVDFKLYQDGKTMVAFLDGHVELFDKKSYPSYGGISARTGKPYSAGEFNLIWFGSETPYSAP